MSIYVLGGLDRHADKISALTGLVDDNHLGRRRGTSHRLYQFVLGLLGVAARRRDGRRRRHRKSLEQLCRYITRPALANERAQCNADGQVVLKLRTPWRDGTTYLLCRRWSSYGS